MTYKYAIDAEEYHDFAAGSVLYNLPGATSFPVRLADEIFLRAKALLKRQIAPPYTLYDPCCGTGYLLTVLGLRHAADIAALYGSDIDGDRVQVAQSNLALLSAAGMISRQQQLEHHLALYSKDSHRQALESLYRLKNHLLPSAPETQVFIADALEPVTAVQGIEIVITDVPYGERVSWQNDQTTAPIPVLLSALHPALKPGAVVAIVTDKSVKVQSPAYQRAERFQIGKRQITFLQPV